MKSAAGILFKFKDEILLGKRTFNPYAGYWSIPGGMSEKDETAFQTAVRECFEEIDFKKKSLRDAKILKFHEHYKLLIFKYTIVVVKLKHRPKVIKIKSREFSDLRWFKLDKLPNNTMDSILEAIK